MGGRFDSALTAIFSKRPRPGRVKTRLHPVLGATLAAELAQAMLDDTVARCAASVRFATAICAADAADLAWFESRYPGLARYEAQVGAELGERMASFFEREWAARPRQSTLIVGSDAPLLSTEVIERAHVALGRGAELVLVPDEGGGYALIGLARPARELFTRVAMSTSSVLARTLDVARELGLERELLPACLDVDTPDDLERLCLTLEHRLARSEPVPTAVAAVLESWGLLARA